MKIPNNSNRNTARTSVLSTTVRPRESRRVPERITPLYPQKGTCVMREAVRGHVRGLGRGEEREGRLDGRHHLPGAGGREGGAVPETRRRPLRPPLAREPLAARHPGLADQNPAKAGEIWNFETSCTAVVARKGTMRVAAVENVEVPAGKFTAVRVEENVTAISGDRYRQTFWYAPGVGVVPLDFEGFKLVLTPFTPVKD